MFSSDTVPAILTAYPYQYILFVWSTNARARLLLELERAELVSALACLSSAVDSFDVVVLRPRVKSKKRVLRSVVRDVLGGTQLALLYTLDGHAHDSEFLDMLASNIQCIMYCVNAPVLLHLPDTIVDDKHERFTQQVCGGDVDLCGRVREVTRVGALIFDVEDFDDFGSISFSFSLE